MFPSDKWIAGFEIEGEKDVCHKRIIPMIGNEENFKDKILFACKVSN
jgi:hypothetical protein